MNQTIKGYKYLKIIKIFAYENWYSNSIEILISITKLLASSHHSYCRGPKPSSENGPRMRNLGHGTICRSLCEHQQPSPGLSRPLKLIFFDLLNIINYGSFISVMPLQFGQIIHQQLSLSCESLLYVVTIFMYSAHVIYLINVTALYKLSYLTIIITQISLVQCNG